MLRCAISRTQNQNAVKAWPEEHASKNMDPGIFCIIFACSFDLNCYSFALFHIIQQIIQQHQGQIDYISVVDPHTLESLEKIEQKAFVLLAVYIGETRLIDNLLIDLNTPSNPI